MTRTAAQLLAGDGILAGAGDGFDQQGGLRCSGGACRCSRV
ncbi:MAG: hypothetical protein AVDCRST_MAG67-1816 [uncultured Solirubrobacteraceae bacterium]|uniref:Uncharacterized protein n=1 Tax=uncultured Solirubrobacteraceae bacterium TaxID=1162706 RepID=A0A6J4SML8_9ACTN|nr:MAG: hypothetical protein AVDCRST_MAG67-1816 [uncultured Solirubrobacteraceae bacterium]